MPKNRYLSISLSQGIRQDVPRTLLPLPFLTRAVNLITRDQGRLENRPTFKQITQLPEGSGTPLKLFKYNNALFCFTDRYILVYEKSLNLWKDFSTNQPPPFRLGERRNVFSEVFPITQKERDIENLAFASFSNYLVFFYTYNPSPALPGTIFYTLYSTVDGRIIDIESQVRLENTNPTGVYALTVGDELWLGVSYADKIRVVNFNPVQHSRSEPYQNNISGIQRFRLYKDRVFYTTDGTTIRSVIYNPTATDKARTDSLTISDLRDSVSHSRSLNNVILYDFRDWVDFSYDGRNYKMVWSLNTGYFLLNHNSRLIAHIYANLLPETLGMPPRVQYAGEAVIRGSMVYIPILRSGQVEVVNRDAISDRIVPNGKQELVAFRPLGLELLVLNMDSRTPPETAQIGRQFLISGPILRWTGGVKLSEYSFTEKPLIEKTETADYDRWPYSDIDVTLPAVTELDRTQYNEISINMEKKDSPFLIDELGFTAGTSGVNVGVGTGFGSWNATSTTTARTLRYSSVENSKTIDDDYGGVMSGIHYNSTEKAIVVTYTNAPTSLETGKEHPQAIDINGIVYLYDSFVLNGSTLTCYVFIADSPFVSGQTYVLNHLYADILKTPAGTTRQVQVATADNQNTAITLNDVRLRKLQKVLTNPNILSPALINTSTIGMVYLNELNHVGAIKSGIRNTVGVQAPSTSRPRDTDDDVTIPSDFARFDVSDRNYMWRRVDGTGRGEPPRTAQAYSLRTGQRVPSADFSFPLRRTYTRTDRARSVEGTNDLGASSGRGTIWLDTGVDTSGFNYFWRHRGSEGASVFKIRDNIGRFFTGFGSILYFLGTTSGNASLYRVDVSSSNVDDSYIPQVNRGPIRATIGSSSHYRNRGTTDGTIVWVLNRNTRTMEAYNATTLARDTTQDIVLATRSEQFNSASNYGAYDGTNIYFLNAITDKMEAYRPVFTSQGLGTLTNTDIIDDIELSGIWTDRSKLFVLFGAETSKFATGQLLATDVEAKIATWTYTYGDSTFQTLQTMFNASTKTYYTTGGFAYVRYEMADFPTSQALKDILLNSNLVNNQTFTMAFTGPQRTIHVESREDISPQVLSTVYSTFDENGDPKEATSTQINNSLGIYLAVNLNIYSDFFFNEDSFMKVKGPVSTNNYYYQRTTDNPLIYNNTVLDFGSDSTAVRIRYPLVDVSPSLSPARLLNAKIYNYKTRFKWLDENGFEHRSQFSDILQIVSNRDIGLAGNQPTFRVNFLNLTDKDPASIGIEVYRTKDKSRTFQFLTEIQTPVTSSVQGTTFADTLEDSSLGMPAGNDHIVVSGARNIVPYKGRFALWGFPDKPNRILISSAENPFSNQAIAFQQGNIAGGTIEILMEIDVETVCVMDDYLIISGEDQVYTWSLREGTLVQQNPAKVTGLGSYAIADVRSYVETTQGVMFNDIRGRGIQLLTRGLSWEYVGEPVKDATTKGKALACFKNDENVFFIKERNPDNPETPQVLVYNQRYKTWSSYSNINLISGLIWDNRVTAISETGELWQEVDEPRETAEGFIIETGWINFTQIFMNYQRLRDIYLLGEFTGLESLSLELDFNFVKGEHYELINFNLAGFRDSPAVSGGPVSGGDLLSNKKEFRFQPRNQPGTAIQLKFTIVAKTAKIDAIRFGGDWSQMIRGSQSQVSGGAPASGGTGS